jgi:outer membrane lipoprotein
MDRKGLTVNKLIFAALAALMLSSCTTVPRQLQGEYPAITPARVDSGAFGTDVRWGGVIIETRNEENRTCFEVLSRNLGKSMRPEAEDSTLGRFIACKNGFYDPEVFAQGRELTLTGTVRTIEEHPIDDFNYRYPIVDAKDVILWEKRKDVIVYNYYDPYYYPFHYPYYGGWGWGYPYYRHRYIGPPPFPRATQIYFHQTVPGPSDANRGVR